MKKSIEEIKKEIKRKYHFALNNRDMWSLEECRYLENHKITKAKQIHEFVIEYQTRMNTLVDVYMIVAGITNYLEAVDELRRKDAE